MSETVSHAGEQEGGSLAQEDKTPPFAIFEWMLAGRYLRARRKEGFISVIAGFSFIGILLGVATLIIVMAVMNGFRKDLLGKLLGLNGHIVVQSYTRPLTDHEQVAAKLLKTGQVTQAIPLVEGQVMVSAVRQSKGAFVRGVSEKHLRDMQSLLVDKKAGNDKQTIVAGEIDGFDGGKSIMIGSRMARALQVGVGDKLTLMSPRGVVTPFGVSPRVKSYPVTAIFEMGMVDFDSGMVFMPLPEAQKFFNKGKSVDAIEVFVKDPDDVGEVIPELGAALGEGFSFNDWRKRNTVFFNTLEMERNVMFIILTLIVLVAALNIISGMIMLVKDKAKDIAVLRTMGASRGAIMRVFLITGASIGVAGTLAGLLLGILFCENIESVRQGVSWMMGRDVFPADQYYLYRMPAEIDWGEVLQVVIMALSLSVLATIYPAWRAAQMDPVEALRYE